MGIEDAEKAVETAQKNPKRFVLLLLCLSVVVFAYAFLTKLGEATAEHAVVRPSDPGPPEPQKFVIDLAGTVHTSIATWASGTKRREWNCLEPRIGFDSVIAREEEKNIGKKRGQCVGPGSYCDSTSEYCIESVIREGCFVNTEWHDWYKATTARLQHQYLEEAVCQKPGHP